MNSDNVATIKSKRIPPKNGKKITKETAKEYQLKSAVARKENQEKLRVSAFLLGIIDDQQTNVRKSVIRIINKGGRDLVSLLKEVRESNEGRQLDVKFSGVKVVGLEDADTRLPEIS